MRRGIVIVVAALALALPACSGDDSPVTTGGPLTQPATEDGLRAAVTRAGQGLLAKDTAATYALLSARCKGLVTQAEWASQLLIGVGLLEAFSEQKLGDLKVGKVEVRNVTGTQGEARFDLVKQDGTTAFGDGTEQSWDTWYYEDGGWRTDNCGNGETGGLTDGDSETTTVPDEPTTTLAPGVLGGDQGLDFPDTTGDTVQVVASGPIDDVIPVVVRNGTDHTVYDVGVTVTVRNPDGTLLVTGDDQGVVPPVLGAGDVAIGSLYLTSGLEVPTGSTTSFSVTSTDEPSVFQDRPLRVTEVNNTGTAVVGVLENTTGVELTSFVRVLVGCFATDGTPTAALSGSADQDRIAVGGTGSFTIEYGSDVVCDKVLVGASGSG